MKTMVSNKKINAVPVKPIDWESQTFPSQRNQNPKIEALERETFAKVENLQGNYPEPILYVIASRKAARL